MTVLVCLGSYSRIPHTGWLINNRNLFLTVLEAGSLRSGCRRGQILMRALFWAGDSCRLSASSHSRERTRELPGVSCITALIPFMRAPPS